MTSLSVLREEWHGCSRCALGPMRLDENICFGAGANDADFLLLFDSPSFEDMQVGVPASEEEVSDLLDVLLDVAGIGDFETFRTATVACYPYAVLGATEEDEATTQDRKPDREEIDACSPRLMETIYQLDPRIIIAMGEVAWKTMVPSRDRGRATTILKAQKSLFRATVPGRVEDLVYPVMATVSPQHMIKHPTNADHGPTATTVKALRRAAAFVNFLKTKETA